MKIKNDQGRRKLFKVFHLFLSLIIAYYIHDQDIKHLTFQARCDNHNEKLDRTEPI